MHIPDGFLSNEVASEVRRYLNDAVFKTIIPRSVRLSEAPSHGLPIHAYAPTSTGSAAYRALADEFRRLAGRAPISQDVAPVEVLVA